MVHDGENICQYRSALIIAAVTGKIGREKGSCSMNIDSIYLKGYSCFRKEWVRFDEIKPVNVIIGRNNSGKSHLLDLVEALCDDKLFDREWQYRCHGVLDEISLKKVFPEEQRGERIVRRGFHGVPGFGDVQHLVGEKVIWEVAPNKSRSLEGESRLNVSNIEFPASSSEQSNEIISGLGKVLESAMHQLRETYFCRLFADRDIEAEPENIKMELGRDGQGATNIIRRFILTSNEEFPREVIQEELLKVLNSIFESDGRFSGIQVQVYDENRTDGLLGYWEVCLHEKKKGWIPLSESGSGLKTVILVLLNLLVIPKIPDEENPQEYKKKSQFTFAFEELENNLHPALLRRLFQYLEHYAVNEEAKIFLTTHSSIALDLFGVSEHAQIIHVSHDGESARTTTVPTHSNLIKIVSELGARPSDLLQANGLIWVEGPSDRIYLNRWIELYTNGRLREGRDYQCVFYGGTLLANVQFASPEEEAAKLANLFQINHNLVVVCDGDRTTKGSRLKARVKRIREEVKKIDDAHIWITDAKEIENYIPGSVLAEATGLSPLPDPEQYKSWSSYTEEHMQGKRIDKVDLAISSSQHMTKEVMEERFDWNKQMKQIVKCIYRWNENGSSEGP